jgi:hypothetical protein
VTREQLEHAIRAACDVARDSELIVFGSQAILGEHPDAPPGLRASIEVDVQPLNKPEAVDAIDAALGELSLFHSTYGFYVHGVSIEGATLPSGWRDRTIPVSDPIATRGNTGYCVESHDLAASKLTAYRDKDRDFVRILLTEGLIDPATLKRRIAALGLAEADSTRLTTWVDRTVADLDQS